VITPGAGLAGDDEVGPLQRAFLEQGGVQCGFCTPGMLVSATALLRRDPDPSEEDIRIALSGNLCRCTGYRGIVRAVRQVASGEVPPLPSAPAPPTPVPDASPPHHAA
jgi:aerobic-type carbon monoxide dehydrogenase small subunit (CoxS/CutS family)